ncbi:MAG: bifunctional rhamnulose-1-phosphate aldolase/short-chain dehydrogenase [Chloroflexi bacterium]|nr:bifunctional rhamnulose-1-phosphate aldolase/short-chain dehydrogenase [Chloroflexota bacterium]
MENRWSDDDVVGMDDLDLLVHQSQIIGQDPSLVVWGGGNTSLKTQERDFRGREIKVLRIKASGADMKAAQRLHFPGLRLDDLHLLFIKEDMSDEEVLSYLARCLMGPDSPRPSIETLLHAFLPHKSVVHTHADAILALTNTRRSQDLLKSLYGRDVAVVGYQRPGFLLAKEAARRAMTNPMGSGLVLMNHGLVTWGATPKQAYETHIEMVRRAEELLSNRSMGRPLFGGMKQRLPESEHRHRVAAALAPTLRGAVSRQQIVVLRYDDSPEVLEFVNSGVGRDLCAAGPATADHILHTKPRALWLSAEDPEDVPALLAALRQGVEQYAKEYAAWYREHRTGQEPMLDPYPRVILVPGVGMWTTGRDAHYARTSADVYRHTVAVMGGAYALGDYVSLSPQDAFDVEYWPSELYKLTLAPPERELARRVALITGGARGIGRAIARRFAAEGAHVVVTDIDLEGARLVAEELTVGYGEGRALACPMDVTDEQAVADAFRQTRLAFGGLDVLVSNAGVAPVGALHELPPSEWRRAMEVNATGHFLVAQHAVKLMREQGMGGSIVFIGTKNVPAPGAEFGAYSASKAAETQLARVLAIENGEFGIRCNIINPDAVFRDSSLWSPEVREQRARAHGIPVEELEEFYRQRNLLRQRVTPEDVAEVALFFASARSSKTTGAVLAVDGGLRDAFPR